MRRRAPALGDAKLTTEFALRSVRRPCLALGPILALAIAVGVARGQAPPPARVEVSTVERAEVASGQVFVGTVTPSRVALIGSAVAGRVVEFKVNEGDRLTAGQPLAQLLTQTIELELAAAEAELVFRKEQLAELENGALPEELERAEARKMAEEANLRYQRLRRDRVERLFRSDQAAAAAERDEAIAAFESSEQSLREARANQKLLLDGTRPERLAQARAQVAMQQANVDKLRDQIAKYTIVTRFDGYVVAEFTEEGDWLNVGDPVVEVAALDEVDVMAHVVEDQVPYVEIGSEVRVDIPALPRELFTGRVVSVLPQGDTRARTFPVKVRVRNEAGASGPRIKSGMYARVTLPTGARAEGLLVPKDSLVLGGPQPLVYAVVPGEGGKGWVSRPVPVQLGVAQGDKIQVVGDLQSGQRVVVRGNERLRPGQPLDPVAPDAAPAEAAQ